MTTRTSRRGALKLLGLGGIGTVLTPAVLMQACREAATAATGTFASLSGAQAAALKAIQDTIIPRTKGPDGKDSPSASDVGSVEFTDTYITHGFKADDRNRMLYQLDKFAERLKSQHGADPADATPEQIGGMLDEYFVNYKAPEVADDEPAMEMEGNKIERKKMGEDDEAIADAGATPNPNDDLGSHAQVEEAIQYADDPTEINNLLSSIRGLTLESYFQSETVGEEILNYSEVPGEWRGQVPMSEIPNGYAWSLG